MSNFKAGDVVQLKSGGPKMTIVRLDKYGFNCNWFAGGKLNNAYFKSHELVMAEKKSSTDTKS